MRSEVRDLLAGGRLEETIYFAADERSRMVYALECVSNANEVGVRFDPPEIIVTLPRRKARDWAESDQIGIYRNIRLSSDRSLEVIVEKDFACLDRSDSDSQDAFPNPHGSARC